MARAVMTVMERISALVRVRQDMKRFFRLPSDDLTVMAKKICPGTTASTREECLSLLISDSISKNFEVTTV
jgi:hypothetical protein